VYELFEHTADVGLRVRAGDLEELFRDAARGLLAIIADELPEGGATRPFRFRVEGRRHDYLMFDWLNELLYTFDTEHVLLQQFDVRIDEVGLEATARGRALEEVESFLQREVKAITYHCLKVEQRGDGWFAEVIIDI
jgi:SHS2 domain-containing protein